MKNVTRPEEPKSLRRNSTKWTRELLQQRKSNQDLTYRYGKKDVKAQLEKMYSHLCCYCESGTEATGYGHIEHRLPKKHFPEKTYEWDNLHWSCWRCNQTKGEWYSEKHPILDSAKDDISRHLTYEYCTRAHITQRGKNTIKKTGLNRRELVLERKKVLELVVLLLEKITSSAISSKDKKVVVSYLEEFKEGEYGSFVKHLTENQFEVTR